MTELEELKERVRILEQRSRRLRNVGIGLALFVIAGLALAQQRQGAAPRTLEAERLIIRYPNGKAAIVLGTASNVIEEQAVADFYTPDGATGTGIYAGSNTSSVRVVSPKGERQIYMQASSDYKVSDLNVGANATLGIAIWKRSAPDNGLTTFFQLVSDKSGETTESMYSPNGSQLRLTNGPDGAGVHLLDDPKTPRAVLGSTSLETIRTGSREIRPLSSLVLFDKDGKVLFRAP